MEGAYYSLFRSFSCMGLVLSRVKLFFFFKGRGRQVKRGTFTPDHLRLFVYFQSICLFIVPVALQA